jgi:hypothetical protein
MIDPKEALRGVVVRATVEIEAEIPPARLLEPFVDPVHHAVRTFEKWRVKWRVRRPEEREGYVDVDWDKATAHGLREVALRYAMQAVDWPAVLAEALRLAEEPRR